jgi:hypothetical protein
VNAGPVILVNVFTLDKADEPAFLKAWQDVEEFLSNFRPTE